MPGYQRKLFGRPPSPPHWCALCMGQESTDGIEYFIETGVFAEHEGVIYLCNRCFEPLVDLSEKFIRITEHAETLDITKNNFALESARLAEMEEHASILHSMFNLRLSDLGKFRSLNEKLDQLRTAVGEQEARREQVSASRLIHEEEVRQRKLLLESLDSQIESRREELNIFIEDSLTTRLEHIGRADLIPILLNNQLPESVTNSSNGDERETDEDSREPDISDGVEFTFG